MLPLPAIKRLYPLLALVATSSQVDIQIKGNHHDHSGYASSILSCPNISPGTCCRTPNTSLWAAIGVTFTALSAYDIAAIWDPGEVPHPDYDHITGCIGRVALTKTGSGTWNRQNLGPQVGASYITVPRTLPPDPNANPWLEMEGILGFVWGGGKWFTSGAAERLLTGGRSGPGGKVRRGMQSTLEGDVYLSGPRKEVYPGIMEVNGTEYTLNEGAGPITYINLGKGKTLNLTDWFIREP